MTVNLIAFGQELTQTVRGRIVDIESKQPLIGASVVVISSENFLGSSTDVDGYYEIQKVPVGRHDIKATYTGYEEQVLSQVLVSTGKELIANFDMQEALQELEAVIVTDERRQGEAVNEMATVSARSFSNEETDRFAATGDDPSRLVLSFAGVRPTDDLFNEIVIRGNSPRGLLWKLEGVEIPSPNHLTQEGGGAGSISMLSNNVLGTSDFYTGAFPAEYGNALSGVFDLKYKKGNNEKREYAIQVGTLGLDVAMEGPFTKKAKASYLINYRYSTLAVIDAVGYNIQGDLHIGFQDLNFNVFVPTGKKGYLSVWGLGGQSDATIEDEDNFYKTLYQTERISGYNMGATGLSYSYFINDKVWLKAISSVSGYDVLWKYGYIDDKNDFQILQRSDIINYYVRNNVQVNVKFNARNSLRSGVIFSNLHYVSRYRESLTKLDNKEKGETSLLQAYSQWKHRFTKHITMMSGVHYTVFMLNNSHTVEPRLGLTWELTTKDVINVGAGIHSRMEPLGTYMITFWEKKAYRTNQHLVLTKAAHGVLGYTHYFTQKLNVKVETYYQYLFDVPIRPSGDKYYSVLNEDENYQDHTLVNDGLGRNYGIEFTIEKGLANNWYALATASLYNSEFTSYNGKWKSTRYNGNFITNFTGGKDFKVGKEKANIIGVNTRLMWAGGRRYPLNNYALSDIAGTEIRIWSLGYVDRATNYFRMDASISYRKNNPRWAWELSFDVQNATNHRNEAHRDYDPETNTYKSKSHLGILPVIKYRVEL